jgi:hypothetical protein
MATQQPPKLTKWQKFKIWVAKRHDYIEKEYQSTNVSADGIELGVWRKVYEAMNSFDEMDQAEQRRAAGANTPPPQARQPGR